MIRCTFGQHRLDPILGVLNVLLDERNGEDFFLLVGAATGGGGDTAVEESRVLFKDGRFGSRLFVVATNVEMLFEVVDGGRSWKERKDVARGHI